MYKNKVRLMHIIAGLSGGGRERRMLELVKALDKNDTYEQYIVLLKNKVDYTDVYKTSAKIIIVDYASKWKIVKELYKILKEIRPSLLHVWTEIHYVLVCVSLLKPFFSYKLIIGFLADGNLVKSFLCKVANNIAFRMADKIVSNSKAGVIAKKAPLCKSDVIYNGFTFTRFKNFESYDKGILKEELELPDGHIVSMMARFSPAKDWKTFLDIAEQVGKKRDNVSFLAVGQGEMLEHYKAEVNRRNLSNVQFLGFRSDVDKILFCTDISLLCTNEEVHAEGVSNSIMEAMAAGKPVIATQGGGTPEIITNSEDGLIIPPRDGNAGSEIILRLLSHPEEATAISEKAKNTITRRFSLDSMVERYKELYINLTDIQ